MKTILTLSLFLFFVGHISAQWISSGVPGARLVASNDERLFASHHTVLRSSDGGDSWDTNLTGLPQATSNRVICLVAADDVIFAGFGSAGLYYSTNNGAQWTMVTGLPSGSVRSMYKHRGKWFAAIEQAGVYMTSNPSFSNWESINLGLPTNTPGKNFISFSSEGSEGSLFVCVTNAGIFGNSQLTSSANWFENSINVIGPNPPLNKPTSIVYVPERIYSPNFQGPWLYVGTDNNGVYNSGDGAAAWDVSRTPEPFNRVHTLFEYNNVILAATDSGNFINSYNMLFDEWEPLLNANGLSFTVHNGLLYFADTVNLLKGPLPLPFTSNKLVLTRNVLEVYPNPATEKVTIQLSESFPSSTVVSIMDAFGRMVLHHTLQGFQGGSSLDLQISSLTTGIYTLHLHSPGSTFQPVKIAVQR